MGVRQEGCLFLEGPPRGLWAPLRMSSGAEGPPASHSVQEERAHTETCATLRVRVVRGREGGGSGWFCGVGEERMDGFGRREGKKDTANEKNKCTMEKNKTSAAAQNKTFDSLFKLVS